MFLGINDKGERIDIDKANRYEQYKCEFCGGELVTKMGKVNAWHFSHKKLKDCDEWYEMSEWHRQWQCRFPEQLREIVIQNEYGKHRADVKASDLIIEFQHSNIAGNEFDKRNEFYSKDNKLVWLFDLRDKHIYRRFSKEKGNKCRFEWNWAYKFNEMDLYEYKSRRNIELFFQISENEIVRVYWNKTGFKYFGGYMYDVDSFMNFLRGFRKKKIQKQIEPPF